MPAHTVPNRPRATNGGVAGRRFLPAAGVRMSDSQPSILWFRRDLRVHDHPALDEALASGPVIGLFVIDNRLLNGRFASPNREWFLRDSLAELGESIRARGGVLVVRRGHPEEVLPAAAREFDATSVFVSRDYSPFGRARDARVAAALAVDGVRFVEAPGVLAIEPEKVVNDAGGGFGVFSAFFRRWVALERPPVIPAPVAIPAPAGVVRGSDLDNWLPPRPAADLVEPGEAAARARLKSFASGDVSKYAEERDRLDIEGTSRLSQDLRWGLLSPNEILARTGGPGSAKFEQEVAWRDFYEHLAWHTPRVLRQTYRRDMANLPWHEDPAGLAAWQEGRTGFPIVDASMRQLVATGYMHNRGRMIVASFLTKNLFIDYREGERFFMRHLVDGDVAVNNGGWQWTASTGTDAQPYFRVFNPVLQGQRHDPDGDFVRRWVPELANVPAKYVQSPWTMPSAMQSQAHCIIGTHYPGPIIDPAGAVPRAKAFFEAGITKR